MRAPPRAACLVFSCLLATAGGCKKASRTQLLSAAAGDAAAIAQLQALAGEVTVQRAGTDVSLPAALQQGLAEGDVISTGEGSSATVSFASGTKILLQPRSSLAIRRVGGASAAMGAVLIGGTVRAESAGRGAQLAIGTPYGTLRLGAQLTVLDVSMTSGAVVKVGTVLFDRDGVVKPVEAGREVAVNGLSMPIIGDVAGLALSAGGTPKAAAAAAAAGAAQSLPMTLIARPNQASVARGPDGPFKVAPKRMPLREGDRLRLKKGGSGTQVQVGDDATLTLRGASAIDFTAARTAAGSTQASYALRDGGVRVAITRPQEGTAQHTVDVGGVSVEVAPGVREADVEASGGRRRGRLLVRMGTASIKGTPPIEAGSDVEVAQGAVVAVRPLTAFKVDLHRGVNAVVYAEARAPALNFVWGAASDKKPLLLEVATDAAFEHIVVAERVSRGNLIVDRLPIGHYVWRVEQNMASRATLDFSPESASDCAGCKRHNFVDDTGEKTVVMFQQALPSIALRWKPVEGATSYSVKVFADGAFDAPLVQASQAEVEKSFPEGTFPAGKYFWLVAALDQAQRELAPGRMNSLTIAYDNAVTGLLIRTPKPGAQSSAAQVNATGVMERGAVLAINGHAVAPNEDGRFEQVVALRPGANLMTFACVGYDRIERIYVRQLVRR